METKTKTKVLKRLEEAMIATWQNQQMQSQQMQWMVNASASQTQSAAIAWQGNQVESLQSIS
jgi:hypothetical protein